MSQRSRARTAHHITTAQQGTHSTTGHAPHSTPQQSTAWHSIKQTCKAMISPGLVVFCMAALMLAVAFTASLSPAYSMAAALACSPSHHTALRCSLAHAASSAAALPMLVTVAPEITSAVFSLQQGQVLTRLYKIITSMKLAAVCSMLLHLLLPCWRLSLQQVIHPHCQHHTCSILLSVLLPCLHLSIGNRSAAVFKQRDCSRTAT